MDRSVFGSESCIWVRGGRSASVRPRQQILAGFGSGGGKEWGCVGVAGRWLFSGWGK